MEIKTIKEAIGLSKKIIEQYFGEEVLKIEESNKNNGILQTKYSIFLTVFVQKLDKGIKEIFPELAQQIMWDESIRISKSMILDFINTANIERKRLSVLFVLKNGEVLQVSPLSILNFCEATKLEIEESGVYYLFPTIFLKKIKGGTTQKEKRTRDKLSIISQINSIEDFDTEENEVSAVIRDFDVDFFGEIMRTLRNIENHLESIEKELKKKKR